MKVRTMVAIGVAALGLAACGDDDDAGGGGSTAAKDSGGAKIAFLLPESKTTRYEQQDRPAFVESVKKLCPGCEILYENANGDPARQQQQAESVLTNGAKALVLDAVDVKSAAAIAARAKQADVPVISYGRLTSGPRRRLLHLDRPLPRRPAAGTRAACRDRRRQGQADRDDQRLAERQQLGAVQGGRADVLEKAGAKIVK